MIDSTPAIEARVRDAASIPSVRSLLLESIRDCDRGRYQEALQTLETVAQRLGGLNELPPRALSAYGLSLASVDAGRRSEALAFCRQAIRRKPTDPILYRMLAAAYVLDDAKQFAVHTLNAGLKVGPRDTGLNIARSAIGLRAEPIFKSLNRSHPANRYLGMLRHRLKRLLPL